MPIDADRIHKPVRKLRKILRKLPKRPSPDKIHSLRTNARRFETIVAAVDQNRGGNSRRLLRDLARLRKRAGKVRDIDVLIAYTLTAHVDGEQTCLVQLLESLGAKRSKHVRKLRKFVAKRGARLRRRLKRTETDLQRAVDKFQEKLPGSAPDAIANAMDQGSEVSGKLGNPPGLNKNNLHPYRLKVKELQYILQLTNNPAQHEFVKKLGKVKDAIGEWHDWEELTRIAKDVLDHGAKCKLLPKLGTICETKYSEALSVTNHMRQAFLGLNAVGRAKSRSKQGPSKRLRVLASVSAIST